jgi:hypothetical protein
VIGKRPLATSAVLAVAAALSTACQDPARRSSTSTAALDLCRSASAAVQDMLGRCEGATGPQVAAWRASADAFCRSLSAEVAAGRTAYDPARANACTASLATLGCGDAAAAGPTAAGALALPACAGAVAGALASGATCFDDVDCRPGLSCSAAFTGTCPGTCAAPAAAGESCALRPCGAGLACDVGAGATCQPTAGAGGPCPCRAGAWCDRSGTAPVCRAVKGGGSSCSGPAECADGLACAGSPSTCQPFRGAGSSCTPTAPGCAPGLACDPASGTCQAAPAAGRACVVTVSATNFTLPCLDGWCDAGATRACVPYKADGQSCTQDIQCRGFCDAVAKVCAGAGLACQAR